MLQFFFAKYFGEEFASGRDATMFANVFRNVPWLSEDAVPFDRHADRKQQAELFRSAVGNLRILQVAEQRYEKVPEGLPQNRAERT